jgi:peptidoglycan lytic transglycosylase G
MKILKIYGTFFLAAALLASFVFLPDFFLSGKEVNIPVYSKTTAREIAQELRRKGVLRFTLPFRVLSKVLHADRKLKAGLYRLSPRSSLWDVVTTLSEGKTELLTLRVPEGYTAEQIAEELEKMKVVTVSQFLQAARDPAVLKELDLPGPDAEGFLFPQTYRVPLGADAQALIELMVRQFRDSVGPDFDEKCKKRGLTPYRAVILASIVEKEAQRADERPVIAGILYNRLHKKMRLEVNATLNYVLADKRAWLTEAQLSTRSPYNTYLHRGLPPTPICNPGWASLQAVLEPADVPYLYFVAQGDGSHLFASTFEEHKKNIRAAKRIQRARRNSEAPAR